jgi:hypothetical protein
MKRLLVLITKRMPWDWLYLEFMLSQKRKRNSMWLLSVLFLIAVYKSAFSQTDTAHFIKVHFIYGSKPKRSYKTTEQKVFGGLHGGHVSIQFDTMDYGFEPKNFPVHIFARKKETPVLFQIE